MTRVGVISDTHGRFDPAVNTLFKGVDLIIHAGDIGKLEVIDQLKRLAPVIAVEGNNDSFAAFPEYRLESIAGYRILVRHIFGEPHQLGPAQNHEVSIHKPDIVIFGHSHRPYEGRLGKVLLFNPGSAGPRRFSLPRTVGFLSLDSGTAAANIVSLPD